MFSTKALSAMCVTDQHERGLVAYGEAIEEADGNYDLPSFPEWYRLWELERGYFSDAHLLNQD